MATSSDKKKTEVPREISMPESVQKFRNRLEDCGLGFLLWRWDFMDGELVREWLLQTKTVGLRAQHDEWDEDLWRPVFKPTIPEVESWTNRMTWEAKENAKLKPPKGVTLETLFNGAPRHGNNGYRWDEFADPFHRTIGEGLNAIFMPERTTYVTETKAVFIARIALGEAANWGRILHQTVCHMRRQAQMGRTIFVTPFLVYLYKTHGWLTTPERKRFSEDKVLVEEELVEESEETPPAKKSRTKSPPKKRVTRKQKTPRARKPATRLNTVWLNEEVPDSEEEDGPTNVTRRKQASVTKEEDEGQGEYEGDHEDEDNQEDGVQAKGFTFESNIQTTPEADYTTANTSSTPVTIPSSTPTIPSSGGHMTSPARSSSRSLSIGEQKAEFSNEYAVGKGFEITSVEEYDTLLKHGLEELTQAENEAECTRQELEKMRKKLSTVEDHVEDWKGQAEESDALARRSRRKAKDNYRKQKLAEARARTTETKIKIQQMVFVRKLKDLLTSTVEAKTFEDVNQILMEAQNQPKNKDERHARYRRVCDKVLQQYSQLETKLTSKIEEIRDLVEPSSSVKDKSEEELEVEACLGDEVEAEILDAVNSLKEGPIEVSLKHWQDASTSKTVMEDTSPKKKTKKSPPKSSPRASPMKKNGSQKSKAVE
ncbi:hypothetical protein R1sor_005561 [Riccia sorocarpa]|uniref:Uncharacterized protein n=1 Tax=Riccia sorocarpa TaxID=122646 RepID=A0ABD3HPC3_9MARC